MRGLVFKTIQAASLITPAIHSDIEHQLNLRGVPLKDASMLARARRRKPERSHDVLITLAYQYPEPST